MTHQKDKIELYQEPAEEGVVIQSLFEMIAMSPEDKEKAKLGQHLLDYLFNNFEKGGKG